MSSTTAEDQPMAVDCNRTQELDPLLSELDRYLALLRARNQYWSKYATKNAYNEHFSLIDAMIEVNSTPLGVRLDPDWSWDRQSAQAWHKVGRLLRRAMRRISASFK